MYSRHASKQLCFSSVVRLGFGRFGFIFVVSLSHSLSLSVRMPTDLVCILFTLPRVKILFTAFVLSSILNSLWAAIAVKLSIVTYTRDENGTIPFIWLEWTIYSSTPYWNHMFIHLTYLFTFQWILNRHKHSQHARRTNQRILNALSICRMNLSQAKWISQNLHSNQSTLGLYGNDLGVNNVVHSLNFRTQKFYLYENIELING